MPPPACPVTLRKEIALPELMWFLLILVFIPLAYRLYIRFRWWVTCQNLDAMRDRRWYHFITRFFLYLLP